MDGPKERFSLEHSFCAVHASLGPCCSRQARGHEPATSLEAGIILEGAVARVQDWTSGQGHDGGRLERQKMKTHAPLS